MKILFLSDLYSTPQAPRRGVANARIVHAMRAEANIEVMSPVPWYPEVVARRVPALEPLVTLPAVEHDGDGSPVAHPRRLHIPKVFSAQAVLYALSVATPLRAAVRRFRPDVLLTAWAFPDATAAVALAKLLRLPVVVRTMGSDINDYAHRPARRPQIALALRHADRVIAVSHALGGEVRKLGVERVVVIPTGVDTNRFYRVHGARAQLALPTHARLVVVPSRLAPEKGITHFVDALATLPSDVHGVLVGDGPEQPRLEEQAARLGVRDRLHFAGFQPEERMKIYDSAADVVCLPSLEEGWPNVLMEAAACGCPAVASDVGGVEEIVALPDGGLTAPAGDSVTLGGVLRDALNRPWDRDAIRRRVEGHTLAHTAHRYVETCAAAVADRRGGHPVVERA